MPPRLPSFDFNRAPFLVIWEVTRACALACVHCRADGRAYAATGSLVASDPLCAYDPGLETRPAVPVA